MKTRGATPADPRDSGLAKHLQVGFRTRWRPLIEWYCRNDLCALAALHGTDKWGRHRYAPHYQRHLAHLKHRPINLFEIGVGGHQSPTKGGKSLRMWKSYFPRASIFGLDLYDKSRLQEPRIRIFQGSQADPELLREVAAQIGRLDVIIDDGSHINEHVITSFKTLFPLLAPDGIYVIEDLQTSYWPSFGGDPTPGNGITSIEMIKNLVDGLNWEENSGRAEQPFDQTITGIALYHNLAFIQKGDNTEGGSIPPHLALDGA